MPDLSSNTNGSGVDFAIDDDQKKALQTREVTVDEQSEISKRVDELYPKFEESCNTITL
jgi:hypothetical protein